MRLKTALYLIFALAILLMSGCSDSEPEPVNTIAPAELTSGEKSLLGQLTETYFAFDMNLGMEVEHIGYEMWIEHYEKGIKVAEHTLTKFYSSGYLEPEKIQDRVIIARMYRTEDQEIWLASVGGASSKPALPISPDFQAWGPTTLQEFVLEQPVMLGIMLAGEPLSWQSGGYEDEERFNALINHDAVYIIYIKVYQQTQE